ncbi:MAG: carotenoid oxygenase family protein [Acidimicrobiia bacterium]
MTSNIATTNPYLLGQFEPVADELDVADLEVVGELPEALVGSYVRNGPNPQFAPVGRYHVFDGDGMLHAMTFEDGRAAYRNRYVVSKGLAAERRAGHALFGGLSEFRVPEPDVVAEAGFMKNTANTHIVSHAGRLLALMEGGRPTEVTSALETVGEFDFDGALAGPMTAHPKIDPDTGEMLFFGYSPFPPYLRFHIADATGKLVTSVDIDLPAPVMMHDFAVTATRVIFFDLPALFDLDAMLAGGPGFRWEPEHGARIGVLDRRQPRAGVRWIEVEPFWVFHFLNAHDAAPAAHANDANDNSIIVEGCRADRLNVAFGEDTLDGPIAPLLHRWRINPAAGTVQDEPLSDQPCDFPRMNDRRAGLDARYGYVGHSEDWGQEVLGFSGVTKHDLTAGTSVTHRYEPGTISGEAVFAPDPGRDGEDGGWLLNFVTDHSQSASSLVVLDAETMHETARVIIPRRVPFGFHGSWIAAD